MKLDKRKRFYAEYYNWLRFFGNSNEYVEVQKQKKR